MALNVAAGIGAWAGIPRYLILYVILTEHTAFQFVWNISPEPCDIHRD